MEDRLNRWIADYVSQDFPAGRQFGFEFPLREAKVQVQENPDWPGCWQGILDIEPALQPPELITPLRTVFDLPCIEWLKQAGEWNQAPFTFPAIPARFGTPARFHRESSAPGRPPGHETRSPAARRTSER